MLVHLRLHGILREQLPAETRGQISLELPEGSRLDDLIARLNLPGPFRVALNGSVVEDTTTTLHHNDRVDLFRPAAGG